MAISMFVLAGPICLLSERNLPPSQHLMSIARTFTSLDWLLCLSLGVMSTTVSIFRSKSSQYEEPAKLAAMFYLQPILQLGFDVGLFGTDFSYQQILGIAIVLGISLCRLWIAVRKMLGG